MALAPGASPLPRSFAPALSRVLATACDPHLETRLPLERMLELAELARSSRAGRGEITLAIEQARAGAASEPLTLLALDTLELLASSRAAPPPGTSARERLAGWLVAVADERREAGWSSGLWRAPYVIGTTDIPRSDEVVRDGLGVWLARLTGADPATPLAEKYFTRLAAQRATEAHVREAGALVNVIAWGHSAGGPAAADLLRELASDGSVAARRLVLLDPVSVLRTAPRLDGSVDTLALYPRDAGFFEVGLGWRRWHMPAGGARTASSWVRAAGHFDVLGVLYDRGVLHMVMAGAVLTSPPASP